MIGAKHLMGFAFIFILLTTLSLIMDGDWFGQGATAGFESTMQQLTGFTTLSTSWYSIPLVMWGFLTEGVPTIVQWDYGFLTDSTWGQYLRMLLFSVTMIAIVYSFVIFIMPTLISAVSRIAGGLAGALRGLF